MKGTREIDLKDPKWGEVKLLVFYTSEENPLGILSGVSGTPWEGYFPRIPGSSLSHALHGFLDPLVKSLGRSPETLLRVIPGALGECSQKKTCIGWDSRFCRPVKNGNSCWEAGNEALELAVGALRSGRYVLLVEGAEFSL
jgi:hypothetical protein